MHEADLRSDRGPTCQDSRRHGELHSSSCVGILAIFQVTNAPAESARSSDKAYPAMVLNPVIKAPASRRRTAAPCKWKTDELYIPTTAGGPAIVSKTVVRKILEREGLFHAHPAWSPSILDLKLMSAIFANYRRIRELPEYSSSGASGETDTRGATTRDYVGG